MTTDTQPTLLERVLFAVAALFVALRFLWPSDTVYILDEAFLQLRIDEHFAAGTIPFSNSRGSSIPLPYGPGALWFYMLARKVVGWHPVAIALWHLVFQMPAYYFLARAISRAYGRQAAAWVTLLAATSPLLFFQSRHPWDGTLLMPLGAVILYLLQRLQGGSRDLPIHALLGAVAGYAANIHLMFGPVMLALVGTLVLWNLRRHSLRSPKAWLNLAAFASCAALVLAPYLFEAARIAAQEKPFEHARQKQHWGDGRNLWWIFLRTTLFSSIFGARIMLDDLRAQLAAFAWPPFPFFYKVDLFGWVGKLCAWGAAVATLVRLARLRFDDEPLRIFSALTFLFVLVVFQWLNIPMAPHYFLPMWWFVFLGIAFAVREARGWWRGVLLFTLAGSALVNASYVGFTLAYLHENRGARNMEASVAVGEQLRNMAALCAWGRERGKPEVKVYKDAFLGEPAFDFLPAHMPECAGVRVTLVTDRNQADLVVHHPVDSGTSAALVADPAPRK